MYSFSFQMIINHLLSLISLVAGVVSIVICAKYGLYKCMAYQIDYLEHSCNYTINFQENHSLAVLELAFLCAASLLALLVIIITAWCLRILRHRRCCSYTCCCCCCVQSEERHWCCTGSENVPTSEEMQTFRVNTNSTHERVT